MLMQTCSVLVLCVYINTYYIVYVYILVYVDNKPYFVPTICAYINMCMLYTFITFQFIIKTFDIYNYD